MNNRVQQRFDRSIADAVALTRRIADLRHAEAEAHAEDRARTAPAVAPVKTRAPRRPRMRLMLDPLTGGTVLVPVAKHED